MSAPTLITQRLILRPLTVADTSSLADRIFGDPDIGWRYGLVAEVESRDARNRTATEWIEDANAHWDKSGWGAWALCLRDDPLESSESLIGFCGFFSADDPVPDHELAYGIAKPYWGRGLATEAATEAVKYMFKSVGVDRLETVAHPTVNLGSGQVLEKVGFMRVGPVDYCGSVGQGHGYLDHFRLDRSAWIEHVGSS